MQRASVARVGQGVAGAEGRTGRTVLRPDGARLVCGYLRPRPAQPSSAVASFGLIGALIVIGCTSPGSVPLHGACHSNKDCDAGAACVEWSEPAKYPFGIPTTRVSRTCELGCATDGDCPPAHSCLYKVHGPGQSCQARPSDWDAPYFRCTVTPLPGVDGGCTVRVDEEFVAVDAGWPTSQSRIVWLRCDDELLGCPTQPFRCGCGASRSRSSAE